jgi:hypothetical protein
VTVDVYSKDSLEAALRNASPTEAVARLWTWLHGNLQDLGSQDETIPAFRRKALALPPLRRMSDDTRAEILERPLENAAVALARFGQGFEEGPSFWTARTYGIDGTEVIVTWRARTLADCVHPSRGPSAANEHPSLSTLVPRLSVCPVSLDRVRLEVLHPDETMELSLRSLQRGVTEPFELDVHLDTLGKHGITGWVTDDERKVGCLVAEHAEQPDVDGCVRAAELAVAKAAGRSNILLLPELAATPRVVDALSVALENAGRAPRTHRRGAVPPDARRRA